MLKYIYHNILINVKKKYYMWYIYDFIGRIEITVFKTDP